MEKISILDIKGYDGYFHRIDGEIEGMYLSVYDSYDSYGSDRDDELTKIEWIKVAKILNADSEIALLETIKVTYGTRAIEKLIRLCDKNNIDYQYNVH